ncbi:MAG: hypothetical protein IJU50_06335, partial [Lachnospiraceae bacterium]|nr:hypothetical protein [Lachnospiraceae bacterium]
MKKNLTAMMKRISVLLLAVLLVSGYLYKEPVFAEADRISDETGEESADLLYDISESEDASGDSDECEKNADGHADRYINSTITIDEDGDQNFEKATKDHDRRCDYCGEFISEEWHTDEDGDYKCDICKKVLYYDLTVYYVCEEDIEKNTVSTMDPFNSKTELIVKCEGKNGSVVGDGVVGDRPYTDADAGYTIFHVEIGSNSNARVNLAPEESVGEYVFCNWYADKKNIESGADGLLGATPEILSYEYQHNQSNQDRGYTGEIKADLYAYYKLKRPTDITLSSCIEKTEGTQTVWSKEVDDGAAEPISGEESTYQLFINKDDSSIRKMWLFAVLTRKEDGTEVEINNSVKKVTWKSNYESIATVSAEKGADGNPLYTTIPLSAGGEEEYGAVAIIEGKSSGDAVITCTALDDKGNKITASITVRVRVPAT